MSCRESATWSSQGEGLLTGAYLVLLTPPKFNITTPSLDFQLFKTLITVAQRGAEDGVILEYLADLTVFLEQSHGSPARATSSHRVTPLYAESSTARSHSGPAC